MNTQEALVELERMSRQWKAFEQIHKVIDVASKADNYSKELLARVDSIKKETIDSQLKLDVVKAAIAAEKEQSGKVISIAEKEAKEIKSVASNKAKETIDKAKSKADEILADASAKASVMMEEYGVMKAKKEAVEKEFAMFESKLMSVKSELSKLLG